MYFLPRDRSQFNPIVYFLALPFGTLLMIFSWFLRSLVKEDYRGPPNGKKRLVIGFHREFPLFLCTRNLWKLVNKDENHGWIGQNSWIGYVTGLEMFCFSHFHDCMLSTDPRSAPYKKVSNFLREHPHDVFVRTDAGRPYDLVRKTAIRLAIESQRDLICFRQTSNKFFKFLDHIFPWPGAEVSLHWTRAFRWQDLADLGVDEATRHVQKAVSEIAPFQ